MLIDSSEPNANEAIRYRFDCLETDNLPVKFPTLRSGLAPDDDHDGHTGLLGLRPGLIQGS
jgi:hypothetical protein